MPVWCAVPTLAFDSREGTTREHPGSVWRPSGTVDTRNGIESRAESSPVPNRVQTGNTRVMVPIPDWLLDTAIG